MWLKDTHAAGAGFVEQQWSVEFRTARLVAEPRTAFIDSVCLELGFPGMLYPHSRMTEEARTFQAIRRSQTREKRGHAWVERFAGPVTREGLSFQQCHRQAAAGGSDGSSGSCRASADDEQIRVYGCNHGVTFGWPWFLRRPTNLAGYLAREDVLYASKFTFAIKRILLRDSIYR